MSALEKCEGKLKYIEARIEFLLPVNLENNEQLQVVAFIVPLELTDEKVK